MKNKNCLIYMGLAGFVILFDQITKFLALKNLYLHIPIEITSFFNLFLTYNKGVSFSLFSSESSYTPYLLSLMSLVICVGICYWLLTETIPLVKIGLSFVLGGAIGNVIDRLFLGYVIDFLDFHYKTAHWPAFNIADSFICLGAFIIFIQIFFKKEEEQK